VTTAYSNDKNIILIPVICGVFFAFHNDAYLFVFGGEDHGAPHFAWNLLQIVCVTYMVTIIANIGGAHRGIFWGNYKYIKTV
jgi:hypothetical protein